VTKATFDRYYRCAEKLFLVDSFGGAEYRRMLHEHVAGTARAVRRRVTPRRRSTRK